ncbi:MAG: RagB/SusD family nutrient uptake outer membrane protein [Methanomicrobiales archaeon]|nr:RagB/SusD family nutrient uptake outer membrane protein [Methanomicrobiales archaeon]
MKTIQYFVAAFFLFTITSCELVREDYTEIYPENFFQTEKDLELAVNALYTTFSPAYTNENIGLYGPGNKGYQIFSEMTTDALWCTWGWEWDELHFQQWYATIGGNMASIIWDAYAKYNFLSKARNTIRRIERSSVSEEVKKKYMAEAKALMGWMGLVTYDLFGPVPVAPDEVLDDPQKFVYLPRLAEEEYDLFMEHNLTEAAEHLPEKVSARGRMTKGAARMILLKYYMIKGYFDKAETLARELLSMEGSVYTLHPDYNFLFSKAGNGNSEMILQIATNLTNNPNLMIAHIVPGDYPLGVDKAEVWGAYVMPWAFYDTFETGDKRLQRIVASYVNVKGELMEREKDGNLKKGSIPLKFGVDPDQIGTNTGLDIPVYRFADVLLSLAECITRNQGQPIHEAIDLVNRVRNRAGLPNLSSDVTSSRELFEEAILMERGHEFYMEGLRRQDLIRFGKYVEKANERIDAINMAEGRGYFHAHEGHTRFWIPQWYIDESKGAVKQNNYSR